MRLFPPVLPTLKSNFLMMLLLVPIFVVSDNAFAAKPTILNCTEKKIRICAYNKKDGIAGDKYSQIKYSTDLKSVNTPRQYSTGHCKGDRCRIFIITQNSNCNTASKGNLWYGMLGKNSYVAYKKNGNYEVEKVNDDYQYIKNGGDSLTCSVLGY